MKKTLVSNNKIKNINSIIIMNSEYMKSKKA